MEESEDPMDSGVRIKIKRDKVRGLVNSSELQYLLNKNFKYK